MGTVHEFATALESHVPVGILTESGGTSQEFEHLMLAAGLCHDGVCDGKHEVLFDSDPSKLIDRIVKLLKSNKARKH